MRSDKKREAKYLKSIFSLKWYFGSFILVLLQTSCKEHTDIKYQYISPDYKNIHLSRTSDTLRFALDSNSYNGTRSYNYFTYKGKEYISFYDKQSFSVNIYDFETQLLYKRIDLKACLSHRKLAKHTTVFYKNLDSLFVINELTLYLLNKSLSITDSINFIKDPILAYSSFKSDCPPVFKNQYLYLRASPYLSTKERKDYKKWKLLYQFDLEKGTAKLLYELPGIYQDSLYGYYFFNSSYCFNDKLKFVLSFPADSNIYETDLEKYNTAYLGKSIFQKGSINSATKEELDEENGMKKAYSLRDSYGSIYFDPYKKRYFRVAEQRMTEREYMLGKKEKEKSIIFFDENFKIIGESELDKNILLSTLFFTKNGHIYSRTNLQDESALYFIRLEYRENTPNNKLASH